ncbi:MAG: hypothetical protein GX604_03155 [Actinobacteria bacterium]|nr:hypothetical protein [Actinomycetota bacterium]
MSRRRVWFTIGWLLALAAAGIGVAVALPGSGKEQTKAPEERAPSDDVLRDQELRVVEADALLAGDTSPVVGSLVLSAGWGSGPEQVAIGEGAPVWGPTDFALSQDCSTIAILDSWNGRVQMYDMSGGVVGSTPIPGSIGIYLEYLANGNLVLFHSGEENQLLTVRPGGDVTQSVLADIGVVCGEPAMPSGIASIGDDLWVRGSNEFWWPAIIAGVPLSPQAQEQQAITGAGRPVAVGFVRAIKVSELACTVDLIDTASGITTRLSIGASDLPISVVRVLGGDEAGNTYVQLEVGSYDQPASAPYRVIRINRDGEKTGELALTDRRPGDWFSTGIKVGSDGRVYQMLRGGDAIQVEVHSY